MTVRFKSKHTVRDSRGMFRSLPPPEMSEDEKYFVGFYKSESTRRKRLRLLRRLCSLTGMSPSVLKKLDKKTFKQTVLRHIMRISASRPALARELQITAKHFYQVFNDEPLYFFPVERVRYVPPQEKVTPSVEDVVKVAEGAFKTGRGLAKWRNKAIILCLLASGVRVNCLARWDYRLVQDQLDKEYNVKAEFSMTFFAR